MKRITYPRVACQKHPNATGKCVAQSLQGGMCKPDIEDYRIAGEILEIHTKLKNNSGADGEWQWINGNRRHNYINILEEGDRKKLAVCLCNMFRNDAAYGIITSDFKTLKSKKAQQRIENDILLDLDVLNEFDENKESQKWLRDYEKLGNAYGYVTPDNTLISADAPRHRYFAHKIIKLFKDAKLKKPICLEIGGGYGGLCLELITCSHRSGLKYINCDLPETLYLSYYFLRKALPKSISIDWGFENIPNADIVLVPAYNKHIIKKADLLFNANSLSEMGKNTVHEYLALMHKIKPLFFLHQNSNLLLFPESERHIEVLASEFPINNSMYRNIYATIVPWQGAGGRYREYLYSLMFEG